MTRRARRCLAGSSVGITLVGVTLAAALSDSGVVEVRAEVPTTSSSEAPTSTTTSTTVPVPTACVMAPDGDLSIVPAWDLTGDGINDLAVDGGDARRYGPGRIIGTWYYAGKPCA